MHTDKIKDLGGEKFQRVVQLPQCKGKYHELTNQGGHGKSNPTQRSLIACLKILKNFTGKEFFIRNEDS